MKEKMPEGMKQCSKCHQVKPIASFKPRKENRDGLNGQCRACVNERRRQTHHTTLEDPLATKRCSKCREEKSLDMFHKAKRERDGRQYICKACMNTYPSKMPDVQRQRSKEYRSKNLEHLRQVSRDYALTHRDESRARTRRYWLEHKDEIRAKNRAREAANKEAAQERLRRWLKANPGRKRETAQKWKERNREKVRAAHHRRRAHKRFLPNTLTGSQWRRCLDYFHHRCAICDQPAGLWHTIAADHWIPITDPRPNNPGTAAINIIPLCHSLKDGEGGCNNSKSNKDPIEWLEDKFGKKKAAEILARIESYFEWVRQQVD